MKKKHKINNLVAKFAHNYNNSSVEEDKTKYKRKNKKLEYHRLSDDIHFCLLF